MIFLDYNRMFADAWNVWKIIVLIYGGMWLAARGWNDGHLSAIRRSNEVIKQAFEQGRELGKQEEKLKGGESK
jgi:hypothetical protein